MSELHDINSFFFRKKKKPTDDEKPKKRTTGVDESPPTKKEPAPAEVRFVSAKFEPHSVYGYTPNKEAVISGSIEFIRKTKLTKLTLELFAIYNNKEENLQIKVNKYGTTEIDTNKKFKFSGVPLYYHNDYPTANSKELFNDAVTYKAVISHKHHEKPLEVTIKFPDSNVKPVDLKKGMYDTKAHNAKPGKYPADPAQGYIEGPKVFDLQQMLEALHYLPKGLADGAFGDKTDEAVKAFQGDSTRKLRLQRGVDKLIELQSITFTSNIYGIVNQKTRDELMIWKRDNYQRPIPELYEHDFDTEATDRQIKSKNESGFFDKGKPVLSIQNYLQKIGVYVDCKADGWFGPKMKEAVGIFQDAAAKGKFVVSGVETELEEKLTGFKRGVLDVWTQVHLKRVVEKGGKVAKAQDYARYVTFSNKLEIDRQKLLSQNSLNILGEAAKKIGYENITITSTIRYPHQQAEAMYTNLLNGKRLNYAAPGMAVTAVYDDCIKQKDDKATTIRKMTEKINNLAQEGQRVSKHCVGIEEYNKLNIVDIETPPTSLQEFISELAKHNNIEKIFHDIGSILNTSKVKRLAKEPCIHVEIKQ